MLMWLGAIDGVTFLFFCVAFEYRKGKKIKIKIETEDENQRICIIPTRLMEIFPLFCLMSLSQLKERIESQETDF